VEGSPYVDFLNWRRKHPEHICITYINSSAAVKSISDVICTSSNAAKIIDSIPKDRSILFGPDKNLGAYLSRMSQRPMTMWPGSCEVHVLFSAEKLFQLKRENPRALVLAHPECEEDVLALADVIGSTSSLLNEVATNKNVNTFIVATEPGILHQMRKARPDARLIEAPAAANCGCNNCPYMKLNTLEKIRDALRDLKPEVTVAMDLAEKARVPLERMLAITAGKNVNWPDHFNQ
jgi:quinolinate synthase